MNVLEILGKVYTKNLNIKDFCPVLFFFSSKYMVNFHDNEEIVKFNLFQVSNIIKCISEAASFQYIATQLSKCKSLVLPRLNCRKLVLKEQGFGLVKFMNFLLFAIGFYYIFHIFEDRNFFKF